MQFSLPRLLAAGPGARLKTRARVVRVEPEGFAVVTEMGPGSLSHRPEDAAREGLGIEDGKLVH